MAALPNDEVETGVLALTQRTQRTQSCAERIGVSALAEPFYNGSIAQASGKLPEFQALAGGFQAATGAGRRPRVRAGVCGCWAGVHGWAQGWAGAAQAFIPPVSRRWVRATGGCVRFREAWPVFRQRELQVSARRAPRTHRSASEPGRAPAGRMKATEGGAAEPLTAAHFPGASGAMPLSQRVPLLRS